MRKLFIRGVTRKEAKEIAPWASVILCADNGCWCFESLKDASIWSKQK
jgi:hypothetical protein